VAQRDPLLVGLGRAIRDRRDELGVSQERLGLESGVHRNYIGGIERAERQPSVTTLARLAQALGVKPSDLLARAERLD
jgi:transcriptional regulator with XRE-family HTH domain